LAVFDRHKLLEPVAAIAGSVTELADHAALLAELGIEKTSGVVDITRLTHVKPREEVRAAEEIANRWDPERCSRACLDVTSARPSFRGVHFGS
jgi:hypothetical protein